jgi:hypothetical protein
MILNKTNLIVFLVGAFLGLCTGFFTAKAIYDQPLEESVTRDTVIVYDTIPHYYPKPVDSAVVRYVTKVLPVVRYDTIFRENSVSFRENSVTDSVAVVVPITTKHYRAMEYDAWVSGYEPSLDSIKVYQKTEVITATITKIKPPNKWELDIVGGIDYNTAQDKYTPYAVGELLYKPSRLQLGIQGGIIKADKVEPVVGVKAKIRIL